MRIQEMCRPKTLEVIFLELWAAIEPLKTGSNFPCRWGGALLSLCLLNPFQHLCLEFSCFRENLLERGWGLSMSKGSWVTCAPVQIGRNLGRGELKLLWLHWVQGLRSLLYPVSGRGWGRCCFIWIWVMGFPQGSQRKLRWPCRGTPWASFVLCYCCLHPWIYTGN